MIRLGDLFQIEYGKSKFNKNDLAVDGTTPLVSSTGNNNGVWGYGNLEPEYKNVISVPRTGSICEAHYQGLKCCINNNCLVLLPRKNFSEIEMIYFSYLIKQEKYRYVYGRQVTPKRLGETLIPDEIPSWVYEVEILDYSNIPKPYLDEPTPELKVDEWKEFKLDELFDIEKGKRLTLRNQIEGNIPYISSSSTNNGVDAFVGNGFTHQNCLTYAAYGSIGEVFYHPNKIWASDNVNALLLKKQELNPFIAMFLIGLLKKEQYRFSYGFTASKERISNLIIKLPATSEGNPDWKWMEKYMKTLGWSREV